MINRNNMTATEKCLRSARPISEGCKKTRYNTSEFIKEPDITEEVERCNTRTGSAFGLSGYPLASVYAPMQEFDDIYDCETGLSRGTIFTQLDLPFVCGGMNGGVGRG